MHFHSPFLPACFPHHLDHQKWVRKIGTLKWNNFWHSIYDTLCPESSENIPILFQGADLHFSNQKDLRNPKIGSKQSVTDATEWVFFQITFFGTKNHRKNGTVSLVINSPIIFTLLYPKIYFSLISGLPTSRIL